MVKKGVAHAIQEAIRSGLVQLDSQLADISERLEAAKDAEGGSKIDIIKQTLAEKKAEAEKKKEEVTRAFVCVLLRCGWADGRWEQRRDTSRSLRRAIRCSSTGAPRTRSS